MHWNEKATLKFEYFCFTFGKTTINFEQSSSIYQVQDWSSQVLTWQDLQFQ